jgi:hypothetical protein
MFSTLWDLNIQAHSTLDSTVHQPLALVHSLLDHATMRLRAGRPPRLKDFKKLGPLVVTSTNQRLEGFTLP